MYLYELFPVYPVDRDFWIAVILKLPENWTLEKKKDRVHGKRD